MIQLDTIYIYIYIYTLVHPSYFYILFKSKGDDDDEGHGSSRREKHAYTRLWLKVTINGEEVITDYVYALRAAVRLQVCASQGRRCCH